MHSRIQKIERQEGYRQVNGRNHGFSWADRWEVSVVVETEEEARMLEAAIKGWGASGKSLDIL